MSYRKRHVKNKIHKLKPKKSIFKRPAFWYVILVLIFVFAVLYFLFFFPKIQVSKFLISGNEKIKTEDIENIILNNIEKNIFSIGSWQVKTKSIFLVNLNNIKKEILSKFPEIENVVVKKKFFETVQVKIEERSPVAVFCQPENLPNNCYFIDRGGIIFELIKDLPGQMVILRQQLANEDIFVGKKTVQENIINAVLKTDKVLKDSFKIDVKEALITSPIRMDLKTSENWQIYFDLDSDLDLQITKLNLLLKNEISESVRKTLQYIDLRFRDRAYYK